MPPKTGISKKHATFAAATASEPYVLTHLDVDGKSAAVAVMTCCRCGAERVRANVIRLPPAIVTKKFVVEGWRISRGKAVCPACATNSHKKIAGQYQIVEEEVPMTKQATVAIPPAAMAIAVLEPPRAPTPAEKALIRQYLDGHFDEAQGMYLDGASDEAAGQELGFPWSWVRDLREVAYGPIRVWPQIESLARELSEAKTEWADLIKSLDHMTAQMDAMTAKMSGIESRLNTIRKN